MSIFRPPLQRAGHAVLDRTRFSKRVPIAVARIRDNKQISLLKTQLSATQELLHNERLQSVRPDPDSARASTGGKCLLLKPEVKPNDPTSWSPYLQDAVKQEELGVLPYELTLEYNFWTYLEVISAILPEDMHFEIPTGFSIVGHVAHLNLRDEYLPYKHVIAEVILDKNPAVKTVINKVDLVGEKSEYRTFDYELLAGEDNLQVEVKEEDCVFHFDYSKVYWNSRLNTEHKRLVGMFQPGEVVCDVMAGVGPFAVPAGKKGVFVWASDLNPESYRCLKDATVRNKVDKWVRPYCEDGHKFIQQAADDVLALAERKENTITVERKKESRSAKRTKTPPPPPEVITIPPTIAHYVMNLPATAIEFLGAFGGLYAGREALFAPHTATQLPMVHAHCFSTKSDDNVREHAEICARITQSLGHPMTPGDDELTIYDVRDVAPNKRMFCASFRLPAAVAFRKRTCSK